MIESAIIGDRPLARPLNLLFLADAVFEDKPGGSRVVAREIATRLAARGHNVTFLVGRHATEPPDDERRTDGLRIVRYSASRSALEMIKEGKRVCEVLWREQPYDIVHTHFAYAAVGPLQSVPKGVPLVRTFHGPWDEEGWVEDTSRGVSPARMIVAMAKRKMRYDIERSNLKRSDSIMVLSDYFADWVRVKYRLPNAPICRVSGGVDFDRFRPLVDRTDARRRLGLPKDGLLLVSVRRLAPRMGLDRLIQAMPKLIKQFPNINLVIGGRGPEQARLESLIEDLDLAQHVRLLGFVLESDLPSLYGAADLFVLPTIALEGFGLVTSEALSCGTPVIGTPVGATPEILEPLDARLLSRDTSSDGLADAITEFLAGDWAARLTPQVLHDYVRSRFDWNDHVDASESVYAEALSMA